MASELDAAPVFLARCYVVKSLSCLDIEGMCANSDIFRPPIPI
jgi:hypothetical protein